jgi:hypothetical protein
MNLENFYNGISGNALLSPIHKELLKLNNKKNEQLSLSIDGSSEQAFHQKRYADAKKSCEEISTSYTIGEVQINTRRYHSTPSRIWNIQTVESLSTKTK